MLIDFEGAFHQLQHLLRHDNGLSNLGAALGQHGELVTAQARDGKVFTEHALQAITHGLEQQVAYIVTKTVVDDFEMVEIDQQQRATAIVAP